MMLIVAGVVILTAGTIVYVIYLTLKEIERMNQQKKPKKKRRQFTWKKMISKIILGGIIVMAIYGIVRTLMLETKNLDI
mgnify:CR=1 FL=1